MKKRLCTILTAILCLTFLLVGCGSEAAKAGVWNENVFTNEWLNIKMTVPEDSHIMTKDEMSNIIGTLASTYINDGGEENLSKYANIYDCMVVLPDGMSSIQLIYENTAKTTAGKNITADKYLDILTEQLSQQADYVMSDPTTKDIAGRTFTYMSTSFNSGAGIQDYYLVKEGNYMATIIISYTSSMQETIDGIVSGITTAK